VSLGTRFTLRVAFRLSAWVRPQRNQSATDDRWCSFGEWLVTCTRSDGVQEDWKHEYPRSRQVRLLEMRMHSGN